MAVGRISGPLLKSNLLRNGVDLAFETDLLYLDVNNNRIGVKTASPNYDVDVNGTLNATNLRASNQIDVGNLNLQNNTISSDLGTIEILPAGSDPVVYHSKIHVDSLELNDNYITTLDSNAPIELRPNGTGTIELVGNTNVTGNLFATGNITAAGNITLGDGNLDNIQINADVVSDIVPDVSDTYRLGLPTKRWKAIDSNYGNIGDIQISDNIIEPINTNDNLIIRANGTGVVDIYGLQIDSGGDVSLAGTELRFGNISVDGDGDNTGIFALDSNTDMNVNSAGTGRVYINGVDVLLAEGNSYWVTANGNDANAGNSVNTAFATLKHALSVASSGDTIHVGAGTFEEIAPLTVPQGVQIIGSGLRTTQLKPTAATRTNNFFLLNGETTIENLTVREIEWSGTTGYAFTYATGATVTTRSAYLRHTTVLNFGSTVRLGTNPADDPYGYDAGDAGRGVLIDASVMSTSLEYAMLFDSVTFIVPNSKGLVITEGGRVEWLNSFVYFAAQGIEGIAGTSGVAGDGKTYIELDGVASGPFQAETVRFTSTDGSTVIDATVESVDGNTLVIDGRFDDLDGEDLTFSDPSASIVGLTSGATATSVVRYDRKEFGAELRSIASANVYGQFGIKADGPDVRLRMSSHDFGYIGSGKKFNNDDNDVITANEITEVNGGRVFYNSTDQYGDYRIGDLFLVDQDTGAVTFQGGSFDVTSLTGINFVNGANQTIVDPFKVETGNIRIAGNTISTTFGDLNITPASGTVTLTGDLDVVGNISMSGNITIGDNTTDSVTVAADFESDLIPNAGDTYDLGSSTKPWRDLHIDAVKTGDIEINDNYITTTNSNSHLELRASGTGVVHAVDGIASKLRDRDGNTYIDTEQSFGSDDNQIRFFANGTLTAFIDDTQLTATQITVDNVLIRDNGLETTISGANLELQGNATGYVDIVGTQALNIPVGTTLQRPTGVTGHIRYNSTTQQFEGYAATAWSSLGGVRDVDGDTYIQPETAPGSDEDNLQFFAGGVEVAQLDQTSFRTDDIQPLTADYVTFDSVTAIKLPVGADGDRPTGATGLVRFNTSTTQFEGYNGSAWSSLGGVRDVDNDTYIIPELTPGGDQDTLYFYNGGQNTATLDATNGLKIDKIAPLDATPESYVEFTGSDGIRLPNGTTLTRPATYGASDSGVIRYNTDLRSMEAWSGTAWELIGGGSVTDGDGDTFLTVETANDDSDTFTFYVGSNDPADSPVSKPIVTIGRDGLVVDSTISIRENVIENINTNEDLIIRASGIGRVVIDGGSSVPTSSGNVFMTDPLLTLNIDAIGANQVDMGLIFERGSDINKGFIYDETADEFAIISTIEQGTVRGNVAITDYPVLATGSVKIKDYDANFVVGTDANKKLITSTNGTTLYAEGILNYSGGRLVMPTGTTAERPNSPNYGEIRYNSEDDKYEAYYNNGGWNYLGIGYGTPVEYQQFTGDGVAYSFTLSKAPSSAESLMVAINGVVQNPGNSYIVAGSELIFIDDTSTAYPVEDGAIVDVRHLSAPSVPATRVDTFTGDGSTKSFKLTVPARDKYGVIPFIDNVYQDPLVYDVISNGEYITFPDEAPADGARINVINYSVIPAPEVVTRTEADDAAIAFAIALG